MSNLWHRSVSAVIENRRLVIRTGFTIAYFLLIVYVIRLLFFYTIADAHRDLLNVIVGAIIGSFGKVTDFWFKKDDELHEKEVH